MLLNGQNSFLKGITSGAPQGSILEPLLLLIYINDQPGGLSSNCKLFADDPSIFSVVHDITISSSELNSDCAKISEWTFILTQRSQLKKQNLKPVPHPSLTFNNNSLSLCPAQKHLGLVLDSKSTFNEHIKLILSKVNKSIRPLRKFQRYFQDHHSLLFIRHLSVVISTTLMLFMTKVTIRRFTKNSSRINAVLFQQ